MRDNSSGTDNGSTPDFCPLKDGGPYANPYIVFNDDRLTYLVKALAIMVVATCDERHLVGYGYVIANNDTRSGVNDTSSVNMAVFANMQKPRVYDIVFLHDKRPLAYLGFKPLEIPSAPRPKGNRREDIVDEELNAKSSNDRINACFY